ncbi:hypothetical protein MYX76_02455 [Desulfobacterota bacterium AH_259_B03_O07]|nr:hypothetical protein [Desulfobacterota bacterium AH_259_B03_O07]
MKKILRRLEHLENELDKKNDLNEETLSKIINTPHFIIRCIVYESELRRGLSDEEKLKIANRLFETADWKISFGELMIKANKQRGEASS